MIEGAQNGDVFIPLGKVQETVLKAAGISTMEYVMKQEKSIANGEISSFYT